MAGYTAMPAQASGTNAGTIMNLQELPRKVRKKMKKKMRRKLQRQTLARASGQEQKAASEDDDKQIEALEAEAEAERRRQQQLWEEAERQTLEAQRLRLAQEEAARREQEANEQQLKELKMRQELLARQIAVQMESQHYGPDGSDNTCSHFMKTGACRFGTKCKYMHPIPARSRTILIKNMYDGLGTVNGSDDDNLDYGLEHDQNALMEDYRQFFYDVEPEMRGFGEVVQFKVCRNHAPHLRGNLYVEFRTEEEAERAARALHERYYGGKPIFVQFCKIPLWQSAICGQYLRNQCSRGSQCNFLHPFRNPGNAYAIPRDSAYAKYDEKRESRKEEAEERARYREEREREKHRHRRRSSSEYDESEREHSYRHTTRSRESQTPYDRRGSKSSGRHKSRREDRERSRSNSRGRKDEPKTKKRKVRTESERTQDRNGPSPHESSSNDVHKRPRREPTAA